jgi:hypothetical protein
MTANDLDPTKRMLHQLRVYLLEDKVVTPKHATLIHKEGQHALDRLHMLILEFVVFVVKSRYFAILS